MPRPLSVALFIGTAAFLVIPFLGIRAHNPWPQEVQEIYNSGENDRQIKPLRPTRPYGGLILYQVNPYLFPTMIFMDNNIVSHIELPHIVITSTLFWFALSFILLQLLGLKRRVKRLTPHSSKTVVLVLTGIVVLFLIAWWPQLVNDYWMGKYDWLGL
jgi:hypothetical protein